MSGCGKCFQHKEPKEMNPDDKETYFKCEACEEGFYSLVEYHKGEPCVECPECGLVKFLNI